LPVRIFHVELCNDIRSHGSTSCKEGIVPTAVEKPTLSRCSERKKSFALRCMLDGIKELQGRVVTWNKFASSVSITSA
jgi:hypothetical protein